MSASSANDCTPFFHPELDGHHIPTDEDHGPFGPGKAYWYICECGRRFVGSSRRMSHELWQKHIEFMRLRLSVPVRSHSVRTVYYEHNMPTIECACGVQAKGHLWRDAGHEYDEHLAKEGSL